MEDYEHSLIGVKLLIPSDELTELCGRGISDYFQSLMTSSILLCVVAIPGLAMINQQDVGVLHMVCIGAIVFYTTGELLCHYKSGTRYHEEETSHHIVDVNMDPIARQLRLSSSWLRCLMRILLPLLYIALTIVYYELQLYTKHWTDENVANLTAGGILSALVFVAIDSLWKNVCS